MDLSKEQLDYIANKVKELHNNVRHLTQLTMAWYAFFVTINYASMGWLAKTPGSQDINRNLIMLIAGVFITQNILGIVVILMTGRAVKTKSEQISIYENLPFDKEKEEHRNIVGSGSTPIDLYGWVKWLMIVALVLIVLAWLAFPFLF